MPDDTYTEVSHRSWMSRLGGAIKGVLVGLLLFLAAFPLLFWNEGRAIETRKGLNEGASAVIEVTPQSIDSGNDTRLVHVAGPVVANVGPVSDQAFGLSVDALRLRRVAEMYQWHEEQRSETRKTLGGGEETTTRYSYRKDWSSSLQDSSRFKHPADHENPGRIPIENRTLNAEKLRLGAFELAPSQIERLNDFEPVSLPVDHSLANVAEEGVQVFDGRIYFGRSPVEPRVGDVRVSFEAVYPQDLSIIARQVGNSFAPYRTQSGGVVDLQHDGLVTAEAMFHLAQRQNVLITWLLRGAGFMLMWIGLGMVLKPLSVLADVVPFLGDLLAAGAGTIAAIAAAALSTTAIAVSWLLYRPVVALLLIGVALGLSFALRAMSKRGRQRSAAAQPT